MALTTGSGGVSYVGVTCGGAKAGTQSPNSLFFYTHELGHNMGDGHTMNYCPGWGSHDFEPGSGNTIMSYNGTGVCGAANTPGGRQYYLHAASIHSMYHKLYLNSGCAAITPTGNQPPTAIMPPDGFSIPILTPFTLTASATDPDGTTDFTYNWDQYDYGDGSPPWAPTGTGPLFRFFPYADSPTRTFPRINEIINGYNFGEVLPYYSRGLNFRFYARDNHLGGSGVTYEQFGFLVDGDSGPFEVSYPNENTIWSVGQNQTVTWDVANTDVAPVSCAVVNILLSSDGGYTYYDTLATSVPNDGEHTIVVPDTIGTEHRIMVQAADNVFFDISDNNFEIVGASAHDFVATIDQNTQSVCSENSIDFELNIYSLGSFNNDISPILGGLPSGATHSLPPILNTNSTTTFTIDNLSAITAGKYSLTLTLAEIGGSITKTIDLSITKKGTGETLAGNAMSFENNGAVLITPTNEDFKFGETQDFSIECWFKTTTTSGDDAILSNKNWNSGGNKGWVIAIQSGRIVFNIGDGSHRVDISTGSETYNDGEWHHVAVTANRFAYGDVNLYIDGHLKVNRNLFAIDDISNNLNVSIGADALGGWDFEGLIDEVRIWRKQLSTTEVRENMHRTLTTCDTDLISAYSFNEVSGDALDGFGFNNGGVSNANRIVSSAPIGEGTADSQTEMDGILTFSSTDFEANYSSQNGASVTATKLNIAPFGETGVAATDIVLDSQYWVVNRYEQVGALNLAVTFNILENISNADANIPFIYKLYYRSFNSDEGWTFLKNANNADDASNSLTFSDIPTYGQFLITKSTTPVVAVFEDVINFCATEVNTATDITTYQLAGALLSDPIVVNAPSGFEISLDGSTFTNSVSVSPSGGIVDFVDIYVRFIPDLLTDFDADLIHESVGANSKTLTVAGTGVEPAQDVAGTAIYFDGNGDEVHIQNSNGIILWNHTVEFWFRPDWTSHVGGFQTLFAKRSSAGTAISIHVKSNQMAIWNGNASTFINLPLHSAKWHHFACTFTDTATLAYYDGNLVHDNVMLYNQSRNADPLVLGSNTTGSEYFKGYIDEFKVWDNPRTLEQIRANKHLTMDVIDGCNEGLLIYYQFDDNSSTIKDKIANHDAVTVGDASFRSSDVSAADGVSVSMPIATIGTYVFDESGVSTLLGIHFPTIAPDGDVVVTYLNESAHGNLPHLALDGNYWIIDNYGTNTTGLDAELTLQCSIGWLDYPSTSEYTLYKRSSHAKASNAWYAAGTVTNVDSNNDILTISGVNDFSQILPTKLLASCGDGLLNGEEEATDCGGDCEPCPTCDLVIDSQDFEIGWGIWNDGGNECRRDIADAGFANSGDYCIRLIDDTDQAHMTTDSLDLTAYEQIVVDFTYVANSMDDTFEDFWLQISTDGGTTFTTVEEWGAQDEFNNDERFFESVTIQGPFSDVTQIRFQCHASGSADYLYLDDVTISGCVAVPPLDCANLGLIPATPIAGTAIYLDGVDDEVFINDGEMLDLTNHTLEFWLQPDWTVSPLQPQSIFSKKSINGTAIEIQVQENELTIWNGLDFSQITTPIQSQEWYHIALVFGETNTTFFKNGVEIANTASVYNSANNQQPIVLGSNGKGGAYFKGYIDEVRLWDNERNVQQVRLNQHLTLNEAEACNEGLHIYYQLEDSNTIITDRMNRYIATAVGNPVFNNSNMAASDGISINQTVNAAQNYSFDNGTDDTNLDMDFDANLPNGEVVVSYLTAETPHGILPSNGIVADANYWIVHNFGDSMATADLTFSISETVTPTDETIPFVFQLYWRPYNAYGTWISLANASAVSSANNTITFSDIPPDGQFLPVRITQPTILINDVDLGFCYQGTNNPSVSQSYQVGGISLTEPIELTTPTGFEISLNENSGFGNSLTLNPVNGIVDFETVYVRFVPTTVDIFDDIILHTTVGGEDNYFGVHGESLQAASDVAGNSLLFDGNGDYLELDDLVWQPTVFTVEFWLKPYSLSQWNQAIGSGWGKFLFHAAPDGSFYAGIAVSGTGRINTAPNLLQNNKWSHCAISYDNGLLNVYHNGILVGTQPNAEAPILWDGDFRIGWDNGNAVHGELDEFRIWNTARTQQQVRENRHLTMDVHQTCSEGLLVYYQFEDLANGVTDVVQNHAPVFYGDMMLMDSDVPAAKGISITQSVTAAQTYSFDNGVIDTNLDIAFANTLPDGEVVVSFLIGELPHGTLPAYNTPQDGYWIVNNYGVNSTGLDATMTFQCPTNWIEYTDVSAYQVFKRNSNASATNGWIAPHTVTSVDVANDLLTVGGVSSFSQFLPTQDPPSTCSDGILNGYETDVDCGGTCTPCPTCNYEIVNTTDFETDWGIWIDGGSDARRNIDDAAFANSGEYCIRLRDNSNSSFMTTSNLALSVYNEITVDFTYIASSMENANEDFWLQISTDGGANFTTVEEWNQSDEFENDYRYFDSVTIPGPFTDTTQVRFRCDASGDEDWVFIDDVTISACTYTCTDGYQNGDETGIDCGGSCVQCPVVVTGNVILQGAYDVATNLMTTTLLNNQLLPLNQPYNQAPWNYQGGESMADYTQFPENVVDWVLLEARDATDNSQIEESTAAFIHQNGQLLHIDGSIGAVFETLDENANYYFVLRHRNHLDVISAMPLSVNNQAPHDFTNPTNVLSGNNQLIETETGNGIYAMIAGDINSEGILSVSDFNFYTSEAAQLNGYFDSDLNLDGNVTIGDFNLYLPNSSVIGVTEVRY